MTGMSAMCTIRPFSVPTHIVLNDVYTPEFKQNEGKTKSDKKIIDKDHDRVPGVTSIHPELKKKKVPKKQNTKKSGPSTGKQHANPKVKTGDDDMLHIIDFPTPDSTLIFR